MKCTYRAAALAGMLLLPIAAVAQTLPQSTQDRQEIANLTYQANLPGTSASDRAAIERRIVELQYRINTAPPIAPMPAVTPLWNGNVTLSQLPQFNPAAPPVALTPTIYGSCAAEHAVVAYLTEENALQTTTAQERQYNRSRLAELQHDLRSRGC